MGVHLCVSVSVCMFESVYVYVCVSVSVCMCESVYVYVCVSVSGSMRLCMPVYSTLYTASVYSNCYEPRTIQSGALKC